MTKRISQLSADAAPDAGTIFESERAGLSYRLTVAQLQALVADSIALTGNPTAPTAAPGDNDDTIATTAFVAALGALKASLASPAFTGVPTAPTAAIGTNTTQVATMAALQARILGTVSQAAGVPTGAIIESGTNANGAYVKWADGTMMCKRRANVVRTVGSANGALFGTAAAETALAWAQTFIAPPDEVVSVTGPGSVTVLWGALAIGTTTTTSTGLLLTLVSQASNNYSILYTAWGRWF